MPKKYPCRYCGKLNNSKDMCENCRDKLFFIRKLLSMKPPCRNKPSPKPKKREKIIIFENREEELRAKFNDLV